MSEKRALSRREWLLIIAILMMVEYWILSLSYELQNSSTVINFVSFAATLASLLLAVIAIIFSFLQSDAQQNANTALLNQIDSLKSTAASLSSSGEDIAEQTRAMGGATDQLRALEAAVSSSLERIVGIEGHVSGLRNDQQSLVAALRSLSTKQEQKSEPQPASPQGPVDIVRAVFLVASYEADLLGYCLVLYSQLDPAKRPPAQDALVELFVKPLVAKHVPALNLEAGIHIMYAVASIARALGIIDPDWNIKQEHRDSMLKISRTAMEQGTTWTLAAKEAADAAAKGLAGYRPQA